MAVVFTIAWWLQVMATHGFWGDLMALLSAVCYSCYTVVIKKFVPDDDAVDMPLLFG